MLSSPEVVAAIQRDRARAIAESRLARAARLARRCCETSHSVIARIAQALRRPQPQCC